MIDVDNSTIRIKRPWNDDDDKNSGANIDLRDSQDVEENSEKGCDAWDQIKQLVPTVMETLKESGQVEDFVSVLHGIQSGALSHNISLHLLLDIGQYLRKQAQSSTHSMRYSAVSIKFWLLVQKLFHGKAIRFFNGFSGNEGQEGHQKLGMNFAVPSRSVLFKAGAAYKTNTKNPGIIGDLLHCFAQSNIGKDVKLSMDGKKITIGFGKHLGEEDLGGFEEAPTLSDRKQRLEHELDLVRNIMEKLVEMSIDGERYASSDYEKSELRQNILETIEILSTRIKEQRQLVTKKHLAIRAMVKKVANWKHSDMASAINYIQTRIIQLRSCIEKMLLCIDELMHIVAIMNGCSEHYRRGIGTSVDLSQQGNYICLNGITETPNKDEQADTNLIKQRSAAWHDIRNRAVVTGSTLYCALGLDTLKAQQSHYDAVVNGKPRPEPSDEVMRNMQHGITNEINAVATLVSKVMPVYYPGIKYREDGCLMVPMGLSYGIVSGDGSGVTSDGDMKIAFELKCPVPGKLFTPDVYYALPVRYSTQILSQMAAKHCNLYCNLCYTSQSSTIFAGEFREDMWMELTQRVDELYGTQSKRPTRKHPLLETMKQNVSHLASEAKFVAEVPSVTGVACQCSVQRPDEYGFNDHISSFKCSDPPMAVSSWAQSAMRASELIQECYGYLRKPAKEILVTMVSDLERVCAPNKDTPYAVPMQYYMPGYSLKMPSVRKIINEAVRACEADGLHVRVVAFDGQFTEIAVEDDDETPLTICRLQKKFWQEVVKLPKNLQIGTFVMLNYHGPIKSYEDMIDNYHVTKGHDGSLTVTSVDPIPKLYAPQNIPLSSKTKPSGSLEEVDAVVGECPDYIMKFLPSDMLEQLSKDTVDHIGEANAIIHAELKGTHSTENTGAQKGDRPWTTSQSIIGVEETNVPSPENDYEAVLVALIAGTGSDKWVSQSVEDIERYLKDADTINRHFTVAELKLIINLTTEKQVNLRKAELVNIVSDMYGDSSLIATKKTVPTLRRCMISYLNNLPKHATNILYATNNFKVKFDEWDSCNHFQGGAEIVTDSGNMYKIPQWYAQPSNVRLLDKCELIQFILDPHHILVNNRSKCCSGGMPGMGIQREAWYQVACEGTTALSLQHVIDLCDRQRNAYAQLTFSEEVEAAMKRMGFYEEATWCSLMRNFYHAVDNAGLNPDQRIHGLLKMREFLCEHYSPFEFPPPGSHVKGLPITQFEGLMTNIDRRIQLYSMIQSGTYNQRSVSSLDSETFFGSFQVCIIHLGWYPC